jgi:hypothetical protein
MIYYVIITENIYSKILYSLITILITNLMCVTLNQYSDTVSNTIKRKIYCDLSMQLTNEIVYYITNCIRMTFILRITCLLLAPLFCLSYTDVYIKNYLSIAGTPLLFITDLYLYTMCKHRNMAIES